MFLHLFGSLKNYIHGNKDTRYVEPTMILEIVVLYRVFQFILGFHCHTSVIIFDSGCYSADSK